MIEAAIEGTTHSTRAIVETFLGLRGYNRACMHCLCVWIAPSLYTGTAEKQPEQGNIIFGGIVPLDREYVLFSTIMSETNDTVTHIGNTR